jgi:hypothetical protein
LGSEVASYQDFVFACVVGSVFEVHADQVTGELAVGGLIDAVEHQVDQVESAEQRRREIDVLGNWEVGVVLAADRVGRSENRGSGVQSGDDAGLCDRDSLLLHNFVEDGAGRFRHLVELIDTADTAVTEDQSS